VKKASYLAAFKKRLTAGCCALILGFVTPQWTDAENLKLELTPLCKSAAPRLAATVDVVATNQGVAEIAVPDLWLDPFWGKWQWRWEWDAGRRQYEITERDVSFGAIPRPLPVPDVRIMPARKKEWVVVVPVPAELDGEASATLVVTAHLENPVSVTKVVGTTTIKLRHGAPITKVKGLDDRFVQVAISTGMESLAFAHLRRSQQTDSVLQAAVRGDESLGLALLCSALGRDQFHEAGWKTMPHSGEDVRAIRDANLYRALSRGKLSLTQAQYDLVKGQLGADYSFSNKLHELLLKSVK